MPLVLENWYWFWRPGINAPESWQEGYKLGSILGSQQAKWLEEAGYQVSMTANHLPQLIKMLNTGRIDVILVDREHFFQAINQSAKSDVNYESRFFRYMPLGAYFSEGFLKKYPDFMALFNQEVTRCPHQSFQLSENEKKRIEQIVQELHQHWNLSYEWQGLFKHFGHRKLFNDEQKIFEVDQLWIRAFQNKNYRFMEEWIEAGLSKQLQAIKAGSEGVLTEIILTDAQGLK